MSAVVQAQKLGRSLMLPVAVLPGAAIVLRVGVLFHIAFLTAVGGAVFDHMGLIFGIGVAMGYSFDSSGAAALAGVVGYITFKAGLLTMTPWKPTSLHPGYTAGVLGGIIVGITAGILYNKFYDIQLPEWLAFFGGRRFVPICMVFISAIYTLVLSFIWGPITNGITAFGHLLVHMGPWGPALYLFSNRFLLLFGLHNVLNPIIFFMIGTYHHVVNGVMVTTHGQITNFFAGDRHSAIFLSGYFIIMMFGLPGACLAMYKMAKKENKKYVFGLYLSIALTSLITGVTEPVEFTFAFIAPFLYLIHMTLSGAAGYVVYVLNIHEGFGFSGGLISYVINFTAGINTWEIIPVGIVFFFLYFFIFVFFIKFFDIKTPGREDDFIAVMLNSGKKDDFTRAVAIVNAIGGKKNIVTVNSCITRLRLQVKDNKCFDEKVLKQYGSKGIVRPSGDTAQIIFGTHAELIANEIKKALPKINKKGVIQIVEMEKIIDQKMKMPDFDFEEEQRKQNTANVEPLIDENQMGPKHEHVKESAEVEQLFDQEVKFESKARIMEKIYAPITGETLKLEDVPDAVFAEKMVGDGMAIIPTGKKVVAPCAGEIIKIYETNHAFAMITDSGVEILVHVGLDTVELKGKGFTRISNEGDRVKAGDTILEIDLKYIKENAKSIITPVIISNSDELEINTRVEEGKHINAKDEIMTVTK